MKQIRQILVVWFLIIHTLLTVYGYVSGIKTMVEVGTLISILSSTLFFAIVFIGLVTAISKLDK